MAYCLQALLRKDATIAFNYDVRVEIITGKVFKLLNKQRDLIRVTEAIRKLGRTCTFDRKLLQALKL